VEVQEQDLIHDWNAVNDAVDYRRLEPVELDDETLRDGLQCPSVTDPPIDAKIRILNLMCELGIHTADIGLPGAGPRAEADVRALAQEIARNALPIAANCAARTVRADIEPIARVCHETGVPIEACTFIGSSPIRQYAEDWTLDRMLKVSEDAVRFAVAEGLSVMYVTEDTTRARPETLKALYTLAIECGATRICLADTVGHATPDGVRQLVRFIRSEVIAPSRRDIRLDWHGHRDRGLGLANTLAAIEEGVDRVHGTALGIGERVGNTEMDLLLINLKLLGMHDADLSRLPEYCRVVSEATGVPIPASYPCLGEDAFRTGTGVHAAAIVKAKQKGDDWLVDRVYSGIPAALFGLKQRIDISHVSGMSNVKHWLGEHGYDAADQGLCDEVFALAKRTDRVLTEAEIRACADQYLKSIRI
jgi:isopropylmalate/homocitrate/citramalate synthase